MTERTHFEVWYSDEDGGWIAIPKGEPHISAFAGSPDAAINELRNVVLPMLEEEEARND